MFNRINIKKVPVTTAQLEALGLVHSDAFTLEGDALELNIIEPICDTPAEEGTTEEVAS